LILNGLDFLQSWQKTPFGRIELAMWGGTQDVRGDQRGGSGKLQRLDPGTSGIKTKMPASVLAVAGTSHNVT